VVFSSFVFLEMSSRDEIEAAFREMRRVLRAGGVIVMVTSAADVYRGNWVGFDYDFPENRREIGSGETFKLQFRGTDIVLHDYLWTEADYREILGRLGLGVVELHRPLGQDGDPVEWLDERRASPVDIYVIARA
jgi:SAM-dependent methyltransferase